jgi:hypothetical protein
LVQLIQTNRGCGKDKKTSVWASIVCGKDNDNTRKQVYYVELEVALEEAEQGEIRWWFV